MRISNGNFTKYDFNRQKRLAISTLSSIVEWFERICLSSIMSLVTSSGSYLDSFRSTLISLSMNSLAILRRSEILVFFAFFNAPKALLCAASAFPMASLVSSSLLVQSFTCCSWSASHLSSCFFKSFTDMGISLHEICRVGFLAPPEQRCHEHLARLAQLLATVNVGLGAL